MTHHLTFCRKRTPGDIVHHRVIYKTGILTGASGSVESAMYLDLNSSGFSKFCGCELDKKNFGKTGG